MHVFQRLPALKSNIIHLMYARDLLPRGVMHVDQKKAEIPDKLSKFRGKNQPRGVFFRQSFQGTQN